MKDFLVAFAETGEVEFRTRGVHLTSKVLPGRAVHLGGEVLAVVSMTPDTFLDLAPPLDPHDDLAWFRRSFRFSRALQPPSLEIDFEPDGDRESYPFVVGHDGRHRMSALARVLGPKVPLPVVIRSSADGMTEDRALRLRTAAWSQPSVDGPSFLLKGPLFGDMAVRGRVVRDIGVDELHEFLRAPA